MNKQILNAIRIISILSTTSPLCKASAAPSPYENYKSYNLFSALISSSDDTISDKSTRPQDDDTDDTSNYKVETQSSEKLTTSEYSTEKEIIGHLSLASSESESTTDEENSEESDRSVSPFILNPSSSSDDEMNDSFVIFKNNVQTLQNLARGKAHFKTTFLSYRLANAIMQYLNTQPIEVQARLIDEYELVSLAIYLRDYDLRIYCIEHMGYFDEFCLLDTITSDNYAALNSLLTTFLPEDFDFRPAFCFYPLHHAVEYGHEEVVELLLLIGRTTEHPHYLKLSELDQHGDSALHKAVICYSNKDRQKTILTILHRMILFSKYGDFLCKNKFGHTPLVEAYICQAVHPDIDYTPIINRLSEHHYLSDDDVKLLMSYDIYPEGYKREIKKIKYDMNFPPLVPTALLNRDPSNITPIPSIID